LFRGAFLCKMHSYRVSATSFVYVKGHLPDVRRRAPLPDTLLSCSCFKFTGANLPSKRGTRTCSSSETIEKKFKMLHIIPSKTSLDIFPVLPRRSMHYRRSWHSFAVHQRLRGRRRISVPAPGDTGDPVNCFIGPLSPSAKSSLASSRSASCLAISQCPPMSFPPWDMVL